MTKFVSAVALIIATATGSAALAATDEQVLEIRGFVGDNAMGLSNSEAASVVNVIHGGGSISERRATVRSLIGKYQ